MGIYDRDYYHGSRTDARSFVLRTMLGRLILVNVVVFILQFVLGRGFERLLVCSASDIFGGFPQVWRLVSACFTHGSPMHILFNMLVLFFFGRELEQIYGKRDFLILYLVAGAVAIFCEAAMNQLAGGLNDRNAVILGASGSVMAIVMLFGTLFPHRTVLLMFVIPMPMWLLCVILVAVDVMGLQHGSTESVQTAHWAHLAGAAFGLAYRFFDLRWDSVKRRLRLSGRRSQFRLSRRPDEVETPRRDARAQRISERIDELLAKIHQEGMGSLTDEEREFLLENSKRYRSS